MGKGYWHDVDNAKDIACWGRCRYSLIEWYAYEELEFKYSLLQEENEKLKKELEDLKKSKQ